MKNQGPAISCLTKHPIPKTAKEAYEMGYLDSGGEFQEDVTGPSTVVRNGYFDFEADGGAPHLRIVIVMPLRKAS